MSARHAIETIGLGKDYGEVRALDSLDAVVPQGAHVGVLGPNGAGKTTAMLMLATLLRPTRGIARVFEQDVVHDQTAIRRRLGLVFQETSIDGLLTVRENLQFAAGLMGLGRIAGRDAIDQALSRTGLTAHTSRPARQLSGGFRRLTDIARAIVHKPDLLLLDEPTTGLDPEHRDRVWGLIEAERRDRGVTVVFSTHYLAEAEACDFVFMLAHGRLVAADTPAALRATVGEQVVEIDGPDAERAVQTMAASGQVAMSVRTGRGWRIGVGKAHAGLAAIVGSAPCLTHVDVRDATLEDVYFARTQGVSRSRPSPASRGSQS
jgi:ABC-2 type transport system ATP-binding protein